jgi:hypothetical protein
VLRVVSRYLSPGVYRVDHEWVGLRQGIVITAPTLECTEVKGLYLNDTLIPRVPISADDVRALLSPHFGVEDRRRRQDSSGVLNHCVALVLLGHRRLLGVRAVGRRREDDRHGAIRHLECLKDVVTLDHRPTLWT